MKVHQTTISVKTGDGQGLHDVTKRVAAVLEESGITTGICLVFLQHTSASLVVQENADPSVLRDLQAWIARVAPEDARAYEHNDEGPDDMPGHLRAAMTKTSELVPVMNGRLALGTWQALYLWEHRTRPHTRNLVITVQGV